jgi:hypothetical protein
VRRAGASTRLLGCPAVATLESGRAVSRRSVLDRSRERLRPAMPTTPPARRKSSGHRAGLAAVFVIGAVALGWAMFVAARAAYGGNSDDATLVLQGQSMAAGHLTLSGWDLSYDAFWLSEVPLYAIAVALLGVRAELMYLVPAVVAVLVVLTAGWLASDPDRAGGEARPTAARSGSRRLQVVAVSSCVAMLLAGPSPVLSWYLLQAGWHAVTALWCLLAFAGVTRSSSWRGLALAVVFLAAGLLGDLLTAVIAVAPLLVAAAVAVRRCGTAGAARRHLVAVVGGCVLAILLRLLAVAIGTYSIGSRSVLAKPSQIVVNVGAIPDRIGGLFGLTDIVPGVHASPWPLRVAHLLVLLAVLAAFASALFELVRGVIVGRGRPSATVQPAAAGPGGADAASWRLDDILVLAILADLGAYALFATYTNISLTRYLLPGAIFASLLFARRVRWAMSRRGPSPARWITATSMALLCCCAVDFGLDSMGPAAPQEARPLAAFLAGHGLREGIGDYWSSSIVTVDSAGAVVVRPVQLGPRHSLERYDKQSSAAWYAHPAFRFFVSDRAHPWQGVTRAAAVRAFGAPATTYRVGTYQVLVWTHVLQVGTG